MSPLMKKVLPPFIVAVTLAVGGGLLDMRFALIRLESKADSISARVERIERHIDESQARLGMLE